MKKTDISASTGCCHEASVELLPNTHFFKKHETRNNEDRDFQYGDVLILRETAHSGEEMAAGLPLIYTGREVEALVTHVTVGPDYGLPLGVAVMTIFALVVNPGGHDI